MNDNYNRQTKGSSTKKKMDQFPDIIRQNVAMRKNTSVSPCTQVRVKVGFNIYGLIYKEPKNLLRIGRCVGSANENCEVFVCTMFEN